MKHLFIFLLIAVSARISAQDSVTVMQYNLLNYGNYTGFCNASNNNHIDKDEYLTTIINYEKPDIFTVNELSDVAYYHDRLLTDVMNSNGRKFYKRTTATNIAGSNIINMMFYDSTKLTLQSSAVVQSYVRDINLYRLYFNTPQLTSGDTIFLNCIVAHLKAGSDKSDATSRGIMASNVISWLKQNAKPGNYLIMGDFNLYTSQEDAWQELTAVDAGVYQFFDPINSPGDWNNNIAFARYHTQSVTSTGNGCQASGGMDDRFDFILATDEVIEGSDGVRYKQGSYKAIGQDGNHFNQSITNQPNLSVPLPMLEALGSMSDHLPVKMVLEVEGELPHGIKESSIVKDAVIARISDDFVKINLTSAKNSNLSIRIFALGGQFVSSGNFNLSVGFNSINLPVNDLKRGFYLLTLVDENGAVKTIKMIL